MQLSTVGSNAVLQIDFLRFQATIPAAPPAAADGSAGKVAGGDFRPVELAGLLNDRFSAAVERSLSRELPRVKNWLAIVRQYADCFATATPVPLVPTAAGQVYANEFPGKARTAWTVFNARYTTFRGPVLKIDHRTGDAYYDAWNRKSLVPKLEGGKAILSLSREPQGLGCVVRCRARESK